jgi:hypothetical protein
LRRFLFLPTTSSSPPTRTNLSSTNFQHLQQTSSSSHITVAGCALLASMSESPRHPNPGLNGYQQDVTQAEVGALSLLVASQTSAISAAFWPMNKIFGAHFIIWCISGGVPRESISTVLARVEKCPLLGAFWGLQSLGNLPFFSPNQSASSSSTCNFHNHISMI